MLGIKKVGGKRISGRGQVTNNFDAYQKIAEPQGTDGLIDYISRINPWIDNYSHAKRLSG
jgi:hypothetical protein